MQIRVTASDTNELAIRLRIEHEQNRMSLVVFKDQSNCAILSTHWSLSEDKLASEMLVRCNEINSRVSYAKAQYIGRSNSVLISAEWVAMSCRDFAVVLKTYMTAISYTREALTA